MTEPDRRRDVDARRSEADVAVPRHVDRGDGWTLAVELLTATFVWGGIGWLVDRWLGTAPVVMAVGFVLGNALGVYLIWLRSQERFTREHAELMARRARTVRPVPPAPPAGAVAGPTADPAGPAGDVVRPTAGPAGDVVRPTADPARQAAGTAVDRGPLARDAALSASGSGMPAAGEPAGTVDDGDRC